MKKLILAILAISICTLSQSASADTLELKNGSVIKGTFIGGSLAQLSFRVGSTVQHYSIADVAVLRFDSDGSTANNAGFAPSQQPNYAPPAQSNYPSQEQSNYPASQPKLSPIY